MATIPLSRHTVAADLPSARTDDGAIIPLRQTHPVLAQGFNIWLVRLPWQYSLDDVADAGLWKKVEIQLRERGPVRPKAGDLMRIISEGGAFDCLFSVDAVTPGAGYSIRFYCGRLPAEDAGAA
jgi:hypothetical protein